MRKLTGVYYLIFLFFAGGIVKGSGVKDNDVRVIHISDKILKTEMDLSLCVDSFNLTKISGLRGEVFGEVRKIDFFKEHIYLIDYARQKRIFKIDSKGAIVKILDKYGKGPKEYMDITDISIDKINGYLHVLDNMNQHIQIYDENFRFLKTLKLDKSAFSLAVQGNRLFLDKKNAELRGVNINEEKNLLVCDKKVNVLEEYLPFKKEIGKYSFGDGKMSVTDRFVSYLPYTDNTIYWYTDGELIPSYHLNFDCEMFNASVLEKYNVKDRNGVRSMLMQNDIVCFLKHWESGRLLLVKYGVRKKDRYFIYDKVSEQSFHFENLSVGNISVDDIIGVRDNKIYAVNYDSDGYGKCLLVTLFFN